MITHLSKNPPISLTPRGPARRGCYIANRPVLGRWLVHTAVLGCILAAICASGPAVAQAQSDQDIANPLNIVLVVVDDLGWADLGCFGHTLHETPHIDRLADQGLRFTEAYAASPVCTPTRASIMTGRHPARLHMTIWSEAAQWPPRNRKLLPPNTRPNLARTEVTLAEVLRDAGYHTAHVGKWHLGDAAHFPETQGFDYNVGGAFWGAPASFFYPYRGQVGRDYRYVPDLGGRPGDYLTDRLTEEALRIIDTLKDKPFFLNLAYYSVHTPVEGVPPLVDHYERKLKSSGQSGNPGYAAMVHSVDEGVGRILARLTERGLADHTAVILISDNGGHIGHWYGSLVTSNAPLRSGKGSLYEGGVRVPLIVKWPGVTPAGGVCHQPVVSTDLYRTILEMAGQGSSANGHEDGVSLVPLLRQPTTALARDTLYFHYPHYYETTSPVSAIRSGDWKLLEYYEDGRLELFNLADDPGEAANLATSRKEKSRDLQHALHVWLESVDAQMPVPNKPESIEAGATNVDGF